MRQLDGVLLRPVRIGNVVLGKGPVIVLTVAGSENPRLLQKAKRSGVRLVELRIDRFGRLGGKSLLEKIRVYRRLGFALIATVRSRREGGGRVLPDRRRIEIFRSVLPAIDAIDLELASRRLVKALVPLAHRRAKRVILSYHNFKSTPSDSVLLQLVRKAKHEKADLVKLAVTPKKAGDIGRLLLFTRRHRKANLVTIGMGKRGASSRVLAPLFGSLLTYTFMGHSQAPGQLGLAATGRLLRQARSVAKQGTGHYVLR